MTTEPRSPGGGDPRKEGFVTLGEGLVIVALSLMTWAFSGADRARLSILWTTATASALVLVGLWFVLARVWSVPNSGRVLNPVFAALSVTSVGVAVGWEPRFVALGFGAGLLSTYIHDKMWEKARRR